jgi:hypothetical protein
LALAAWGLIVAAGLGEEELSGWSSRSLAENMALADTLEACYRPARIRWEYRQETLQYGLRVAGVGAPSGAMRLETRLAEYGGRPAFHIRQEIAILNRRQQEESFIDAQGLFPCEYKRTIRRPGGEDYVNTIRWDPIGQRIFFEKHVWRGDRVIAAHGRRELRLGKDLPADVLDPLAALFRFRIRAAEQGTVGAWTARILEDFDEQFLCVFQPAGTQQFHQASIRTAAATIEQKWTALDRPGKDREGAVWFALSPPWVPVQFTTELLGIKGAMKLTAQAHEQQSQSP